MGTWNGQPNQAVASEQLSLFVDGAQVDTVTISDGVEPSAPLTALADLEMGRHHVWGTYLQGELDDVRVYHLALTPAQVADIADIPVVSADPVGGEYSGS